MSDHIAAALRLALQPHLKRAGFAKASLVWRAKRGDITQVMSVQRSRGEFVLNLGTYVPAIEKLLHHTRHATPTEVQCTLRKRIGPARSGSDPWWNASTEAAALGADVHARYVAVGEPWFACTTDLQRTDDELDGDYAFAFVQYPLAPIAFALAVDRKPRAQTRMTKLIESVYATRRERAAQFPNDPFALDLLKDARRLGKEHGLDVPTA